MDALEHRIEMAFDRHRAACIIVDAELIGIATTCNNYKIPRSTIKRYRDRLKTDTELQRLATEKRLLATPKTPPNPTARDVLEDCVAFIQKAAVEGNHKDPEMIHAITGAFKTIADARRADRALEEYLNALNAQNSIPTRPRPGNDGRTLEATSPNVRG